MKKLLSLVLAFVLVVTVCPATAFADGHTVRTQVLVLGSESMSNEQEGWSYDAATHTLVLNNVTIDCSDDESDGTCIYAADDLNIVLEGESTLVSKTEYYDMLTRYCPIQTMGNLTISGAGILNIKEGNIALYTGSSSNSITVNGGDINIEHIFNSNIDRENAQVIMVANLKNNTVINDGIINSDASLFAKEINGGTVNAYSVLSNNNLTVNDGEINTSMLFGLGVTINGGKINITGGNINTFIKEYMTDSKIAGIISPQSFEMNGGEVYVYGSICSFCGGTCSFNGGSFVAESEGIAFVAGTESDENCILLSEYVKVEEPQNYKILSADVQPLNLFSSADSPTDDASPDVDKVYSFFDATVTEPYIETNSTDYTVSTNAAKRVVIKEYWDYSISADIESLDFGTVCYDSKNKTYVPAAVEVTLTNTGNRPVYIHPWSYPASDNAFGFIRQSDFPESKSLQPGESITYSVKPREELKPGNYEGYIEFPTSPRMFAGGFQYRLQIPVSYVVNNHEYGEYVSNNDATYDSDGTKTHVCALCGKKQTVWDKGTKLIRNGWFNIENAWYYYIEDEAQTGWLEDGGQKYYLNEDGIMQTGWQNIDGNWYYFAPSGRMCTGWIRDAGNWYYCSNATGVMQASSWIKSNGTWYYVSKSGAMQTNSWIKTNGSWYYVNAGGAMLANTTQSINGKKYKFNFSGICINP